MKRNLDLPSAIRFIDFLNLNKICNHAFILFESLNLIKNFTGQCKDNNFFRQPQNLITRIGTFSGKAYNNLRYAFVS